MFIAGGDGLQIWRMVANILNKQLRIADKGLYSSLGVEHGANNALPKKIILLRNVTKGLGFGNDSNKFKFDSG
jgi:hypothetical protein